jgi:hypothetical protein
VWSGPAVAVVLAAGGCGLVGFEPAHGDGGGADPTDAAPAPPCQAGEVSGSYGSDLASLPAWSTVYSQPDGSIGIDRGALQIVPSATEPAPAYLGMWSPPTDLRGRRIVVEVSAMVDTSKRVEAGLWISVSETVDTYAGVVQAQGSMGFDYVEDGARVDSAYVPYDPVMHRWWQIREVGGRAYFEGSADGMAWTTLGDIPTPPHFASGRIEVGAGTYAVVSAPLGAARFELLGDCTPPS